MSHQPATRQHGEQPYECPQCGHTAILRAVWVEIAPEHRTYSWETEKKLDPTCPYCAVPMVWAPVPSQGFDVLPGSFIVDGETIGRGPGEVRFSSLNELRAVERESERRFRNGEGQIVNFREFTQDRGNRLRNSFTDTGYETGRSQRPDRSRRQTVRGLPIQVRAYEG